MTQTSPGLGAPPALRPFLCGNWVASRFLASAARRTRFRRANAVCAATLLVSCWHFRFRHCEEPTGPAFGRPDDKLRDEAIQACFVTLDCFAEPVIGRRGARHRARIRGTRWR